MKMKKSTWLLLVLAIAAIFLVAGCAPTGPGEEPGGEEPPITPPPADTACPKVVSTVVSKLYAATAADPNFQIKITFDEDFNSSCIENPDFWTITVANADRVGTPVVSGVSVSVSGKVVTVKARVVETGIAPTTYELVELPEDWEEFTVLADAIAAAQAVVDVVNGYSTSELFYFLGAYAELYYALLDALEAAEAVLADPEATETEIAAALAALNAAYGGDPTVESVEGLGLQAVEVPGDAPVFYGLICNQDDADEYVFGEVKSADEVSWKLTDCAVYDELGNVCCEFSGKACCVEPYCEECPPPCELTEPGACL